MKNSTSHLVLFVALCLASIMFVGAYNLRKLLVLIPLCLLVTLASYINTELRK
jgi:hypothetical protein